MATPSLLLLLLAACVACLIKGSEAVGTAGCLHDPPAKFETPSGNGKYFYMDNRKELSFLEAREECWREGGHDLAMPHTFQDYELLNQMADAKGVEKFFIGFLDETGAICNGTTATSCNSQLRGLDGQVLNYAGSSFSRDKLFELNAPNQRCMRLHSWRFWDIWCNNSTLNFACEFNCNTDLPPNLGEGVQQLGSVLAKIHYGFDPAQEEDPCPSNSRLFEPRDDNTTHALRRLLVMMTEDEVVVGINNSLAISCSSQCDSETLTFLSDGKLGNFPPEYFSIQNLSSFQGVSAKIDFVSNKILLQSTEADGLPFICQVNPPCTGMDPTTLDQNKYKLVHYNDSVVRGFFICFGLMLLLPPCFLSLHHH